MFSVKLFDPTITGADEPLPELEPPPEDGGEKPHALSMVTNAVIRTNVKASFLVIFLFSLLTGLPLRCGGSR
jgi:hypothetical protein